MGFWKTFFGGESNPEEDKRNADERRFDMFKYDGQKAMRIGQFDFAAKCFEQALAIKDDPETHDYLSRAYLRQGRMDDALREVKTLVATEPDNVNLMMQAASIAYMKEDYAEMTALCEQALAVDPDHALVHMIYGKAELGQEHTVEGIARLTKAIALDENLAEARLLRGRALLSLGDTKGAADDAQWLTANAPDDEDALLLRARVETAQGNTDQALASYQGVIDLNPFNIDAYRERGKLRFDLGDKQGAEADMQQVLELNPQALADVNGEYSAEGIEQKTRQAYSNLNPFGI